MAFKTPLGHQILALLLVVMLVLCSYYSILVALLTPRTLYPLNHSKRIKLILVPRIRLILIVVFEGLDFGVWSEALCAKRPA